MRIELDDVQALAFEACSDNTQTKVAEAADKAKKGQALVAEAKRTHAAAIARMSHCLKTIASCHGIEEIPREATIDRTDGRIVVTWEEKPAEIADATPEEALLAEPEAEAEEASGTTTPAQCELPVEAA